MGELFVKYPTRLIYDRKISAKAKLLYAMIADMADENGCAEVTISRLQWLMGAKSDKTIRELERELYESGYVQIIRTGRASTIWVKREDSGGNWSAIDQEIKNNGKRVMKELIS